MKFSFVAAVALGALMALPVEADEFAPRCDGISSEGTCAIYRASLIQLIAHPSSFHGKKVRVIGYLVIEFEGDALYLHEQDFRHSLSANGLALAIPENWPPKDTLCRSESYALLEGTFDAQNMGHGGLFTGGLKDVTRCTPWP